MSNFNKKVTQSTTNVQGVETTNENKRYDMCYVDFDTVLFRCAKFMQEDYIEVTHLPSGNVKEFKNKTAFGIRGDKIIEVDVDKDLREDKDGNPVKWLGWLNHQRSLKGQPLFTIDDFKVESKERLSSQYSTYEEALQNSLNTIDYNIGTIKRFMDAKDYMLCIGAGEGNYRDSECKDVIYKGNRDGKPLYFTEFREALLAKYGRKIKQSVFCEAEDLLQHYASLEESRVGTDLNKWKICITYIDKDVDMTYAPSFNYDNLDKGWRLPTKLECEGCLAAQVISGDPTDNITGLPALTDKIREVFNLSKRMSATKSTAEKLLEGSTSVQELWKRVVFCYQQYYCIDIVHKFKDVHGENQEWTWVDFMQQTYILVKMQDHKDKFSCVRRYLGDIGVSLDEVSFDVEVIIDQTNLIENLDKLKGVCETLLPDLKGYKTKKKGELIEIINIIVEKHDNMLEQFENFYEMRSETKVVK